ncbi:MAG TPA: DUF3455 domain-containing protein [Actinoplanes sp.]|jgi:hypothetical protein
MYADPNPNGFDTGETPTMPRQVRPADKPRSRGVRIAAIAATMLCGSAGVIVAGNAFAGDGTFRGRQGRDSVAQDGGGRGGDRGGQAPAPQAPAPQAPAGGGNTGDLRPDGNTVSVGEARVTNGVQIYTCANGSFAGASVPEADLEGDLSIHHFGGPSWQSNRDGSLLTAAKAEERAVGGAIPELLLNVTSRSGEGELTRVSHIQRLGTSGGVAPAGQCTDGEKASVPYQATYVFLAPA